jgi:hypothetical protein
MEGAAGNEKEVEEEKREHEGAKEKGLEYVIFFASLLSKGN